MDNYFKDSMNELFNEDISRLAYKNKSNHDFSDNINNNNKFIVIPLIANNSQVSNSDNFNGLNDKLNNLNNEIIELKRINKIIPVKDEEIKSLKNKIKDLENFKIKYQSLENKSLKLIEENNLYKQKYNDLENKLNKLNDNLTNNIEIEEVDDIEDIEDIEDIDENNREKIIINIDNLKNILSNRLKNNQEKYIDNLLLQTI